MDIEIHVLSYSAAIYNSDRNVRNDMVAGLKENRLMKQNGVQKGTSERWTVNGSLGTSERSTIISIKKGRSERSFKLNFVPNGHIKMLAI